MKIDASDISGLRWGVSLRDDMNSPAQERNALIENFLFEDSILMFAADPGVGKSLIILQMAMHMSVASPVFGMMTVPNPITTLIIQGERTPREMIERMIYLEGGTGMDEKRIIITPDLQGLDLTKEADQITALNKMDRIRDVITYGSIDNMFKVVVLDPIYSMVAADLSKPEPATMVGRFSANIQRIFETSNILVHHTNRGTFDKDAGKRIGSDFFGSQFLKAHVTGAFVITNGKNGALITKIKDSHSNLIDKLELTYDPENYMSYLPLSVENVGGRDRLIGVCRQFAKRKMEFDFNDMIKGATLSDSSLRRLMRDKFFNINLQVVRKDGRKRYYNWIEPKECLPSDLMIKLLTRRNGDV